jgi:hypothetical protein
VATLISDLRPILKREVNVPGFEQLPDISGAQLDGYIADGFWEARLSGLLVGYTITDGSELVPPAESAVIKKTSDDGDLEQQWHILVSMFAALKMIRLKALNLATNFKAVGGPIEYEQQVSATVLRAILEALERRVAELRPLYSDLYGGATFIYFDGALQREAAILQELPQLSVL